MGNDSKWWLPSNTAYRKRYDIKEPIRQKTVLTKEAPYQKPSHITDNKATRGKSAPKVSTTVIFPAPQQKKSTGQNKEKGLLRALPDLIALFGLSFFMALVFSVLSISFFDISVVSAILIFMIIGWGLFIWGIVSGIYKNT